jgi:hypothetical protein
MENYFQNLHNFTKAAKASDRFLFTYLLGTGHFRYRVPNEDELRWQFNGAVATGVNGIFWFTFYTPWQNNNYRGGAIDEFGKETETYSAMQRVHNLFLRDYEPILNKATHRKTLCIGRTYGGYARLTPVEPIAIEQGVVAVKSDYGVPGLISFFYNEAGETLLLLFNNSYSDSDTFSVTLRPEVKKIWRLYGNSAADFEHDHWDARFYRSETAVELGVSLAPGQINIFKLEY